MALRGKPYCYFHTRLHRFAAAPSPGPMDSIKIPVLEDRSAIQIAIAQVLDALCSSRLDPKRAYLFLYAIQIASKNVERKFDIIPSATEEDVTQTDTGDDLGVQVRVCDACATCPERDTCEDCEPDDEDEEDGEEED
jgi:hypothetical protein